ncbi:MAG: peptidoglycan D,D-transpeptidase FtsI family protein [Actinomycetota bacterium]
MLLFGLMAARLVVLQIFEGPAYAKLAAEQQQKQVTFAARRGGIFDRSGEPLAISVDLQTVFVDPAFVEDPVAEAREIAPLLDMPVREIQAKLIGSTPDDRFEYLARQVEPKLARKIEALELPGIYMQEEPKRFYPGGRLASHVLGFVDVDGKGLEGIEAQYDDILEGKPGYLVVEQDPTGELVKELSEEPAEPGRSLFLTIDKEIQYFTQLTLADAARRFHAESGTAIVMRPHTGEILAMANVPDFDPNKAGEFETLERRNRAVTDVYEPGSAYKVVALSGALEEGVVTPHTSFGVPDSFAYSDRVFHDSHPHAPMRMTVTEIIEQSSNVGTIQIGLKLGEARLDRYVRKFGFGSETGLDFPGESPGIVLARKDWTGPTVATVPIGQGIAVTPLQMAAAYSTIANGGVWVEPKLLSGSMTGSGRVRPSTPPATRRVVSGATAAKVSRILKGVAEVGTGIEAQIPGYAVAGKTGTAQKPLETGGYGNSYVASFAGFAPVTRPAVVVLVVLDNPSPIWGGSTAAPTFKTIMEFTLRHLGVSPTSNAQRSAEEIRDEQAQDTATYD